MILLLVTLLGAWVLSSIIVLCALLVASWVLARRDRAWARLAEESAWERPDLQLVVSDVGDDVDRDVFPRTGDAA